MSQNVDRKITDAWFYFPVKGLSHLLEYIIEQREILIDFVKKLEKYCVAQNAERKIGEILFFVFKWLTHLLEYVILKEKKKTIFCLTKCSISVPYRGNTIIRKANRKYDEQILGLYNICFIVWLHDYCNLLCI